MHNAVPPGVSPHAPSPRRGIALVLTLFAAVSLFAQYAVRLDYGPDEPFHLEYVYVLATYHRLPSPAETHLVQHPPLYYALLAVPWKLIGGEQAPSSIRPGPDALRRMDSRSVLARRSLRATSLLLCLLTLLVLARLSAVLGVPAAWQPLLVFLAAACPMFQYMSAVVNNENASILCSTVVCLVLVTRVCRGDCSLRQAFGIGLLVGLCPWVKQTALLAAPLAAWVLWTTGEPARRWSRLGVSAAAALVLGIGWPLHNFLAVGDPFPNYLRPPGQDHVAHAVAMHPLALWHWTQTILETGVLPDWSWGLLSRSFATVGAVAEVAVAVGVFALGLRDREDPRGRQLRAMAMTALGLLLLGIIQYCIFKDWHAELGGRYLLNGVPWFVVLLGSGLAALARRFPSPVRVSPYALLAAVLLAVFDAGLWYLAHLYYSGPAFAHA